MAWTPATPTGGAARSGVTVGDGRGFQRANPSAGLQRSDTLAMGNRSVVFAGHGSYAALTDVGGAEYFTVPAGMRIVFWCLHGNPFHGSGLDKRLHMGDFNPQEFNDATPLQDARAQAAAAAAGRDPSEVQGRAFQMGAHRSLPEIFEGGSRCRQYRLTPPTGLSTGGGAGDVRFVTVADRGPSGIGHRLEDLLILHRSVCINSTVHWAACRVVKHR